MIIEPIKQEDISEILQLKRDIFHNIYESKEKCDEYTIRNLNLSYSICIKENETIVGFYLLNPRNLHEVIANKKPGTRDISDKKTYETLKGKKGIQGVTLCIRSELRGLGLGSKLIEYPSKLGFDYIRGFQSKKLNNLDHRLKRRIIIGESEKNYLTVEIF